MNNVQAASGYVTLVVSRVHTQMSSRAIRRLLDYHLTLNDTHVFLSHCICLAVLCIHYRSLFIIPCRSVFRLCLCVCPEIV